MSNSVPSVDIPRIVVARTMRGFADGFVSVLLAQYLTEIGLTPFQVGAVVTGTLLGSAVLTLGFGLTAHRTPLRSMLLAAAAIMAATGLGFAAFTSFWPLLVVAIVGTLNPTSGDVSVFLPTEQAVVASNVDGAERPRTFAYYNLAGAIAGAFGALVSSAPERIADQTGWTVVTSQRACFLVYAAIGLILLVVYRGLRTPAAAQVAASGEERRRVLAHSRRTILRLAALFSLDSAGSGFVGTSLLVLWLHLRFDLSTGATARVFFAIGLLGGCSQLLAPRLARRIGLVPTMAWTHIPANVLLVLAAFAPNGRVAVALLLARALFAQMDVPARQAFVMAVVAPEERAAAASITNVPRSLAAATTPLLAGWLLTQSTFGWPLVIAGTMKLSYDVTLLALYRDAPASTIRP